VKNANPLSAAGAALLLALAGLAPAACRRPPAAAEAAAPRTVAALFPLRLAGRTIRVQVAILPPEQERGLMERRQLGPNEGMIFVDPGPQAMHFWMHDTPIPLEIGFFTPAGVLAEIYPLLPYDEQPVSSLRSDLQFAVEMSQGWFDRNGVDPGARLNLGDLAAALRARGFDPRRFGLGAPEAGPD
jgi:uncharacterized protein